MASETLSYKYNSQSSITSAKGKENLLLSKFNEVEKGIRRLEKFIQSL